MKHTPSIPGSSDLVKLYASMKLIRTAEEVIAQRYHEEGKIKCPVHLSIGQEAAAVGICSRLNPDDIIWSAHRSHAHYLAKGGDLNRMIAEMYGKETGCAHGRGGSMHLIDTPCGMYGTSAIVCGSMPFPVGAALSFKLRGEPRVSVAFFGDAGVEPGVFHECMNFASYHRLPVIFACEDNDYSTMATRKERQCVPIAQRGAGYGVPSIEVDGNDLLAVCAAAEGAITRARSGGGPTLIVMQTYRIREHVEHIAANMKRPPEEYAYWMARDPVKRFRAEIRSYGISPNQLEDIDVEVRCAVEKAFAFAEESPPPKVSQLLRGVGDEVEDLPEPSVHGERQLAYNEAVAEATMIAMGTDPNVFILGLHVTDSIGIFGTTRPAFLTYGSSRVIETPIMEASLTSIAGGAAMMGMRPLMVHARNDFLLLCMSQLGNDLALMSYMTGGALKVPVVIRALIGRTRGQGGHHAKSLQSLFAHFPGMHVVAPSNAFDAKGLLLTALLDGKVPVIFLEHRLCHPLTTVVPEESYKIPLGKARIVREGRDVTIVSLMQGVYEASRAADILAEQDISAEVIDLRTIRPWDKEAVCASVNKTGRLIIMDTSWVEFGISAEIAATVVEREFAALVAPPVRFGLQPCPAPMSEPLETAYYPASADIVRSVCRLLNREPPRDLREGFATGEISGPF